MYMYTYMYMYTKGYMSSGDSLRGRKPLPNEPKPELLSSGGAPVARAPPLTDSLGACCSTTAPGRGVSPWCSLTSLAFKEPAGIEVNSELTFTTDQSNTTR